MTAPHSIFTVMAITVADLDRATRFYRDAFGFIERNTTRPNGGAAGVAARFIQKDATVIELVEFTTPLPPNRSELPMGQAGTVSHIVFNVADLRETEAAVLASGGTIVDSTRVAMELAGLGPVEIVYARDPDGAWIELCSIDEAARLRYGGLE